MCIRTPALDSINSFTFDSEPLYHSLLFLRVSKLRNSLSKALQWNPSGGGSRDWRSGRHTYRVGSWCSTRRSGCMLPPRQTLKFRLYESASETNASNTKADSEEKWLWETTLWVTLHSCHKFCMVMAQNYLLELQISLLYVCRTWIMNDEWINIATFEKLEA